MSDSKKKKLEQTLLDKKTKTSKQQVKIGDKQKKAEKFGNKLSDSNKNKKDKDKKTIEQKMYPKLPKEDKTYSIYQKFDENYNANKDLPSNSLIWSLYDTFKFNIYVCFFLKLIFSVLMMSQTFYIQAVIKYAQNDTKSEEESIKWICIIVGLKLIQNVFDTQGEFHSNTLAIMIISKSLKVSLLSNKDFEQGTLVNYLQSDTSKVELILNQVSQLLFIPIQLAIGMIFMYFSIGNTMFVGLFILGVMSYINWSIVKKDIQITGHINKAKDKRVKMSNEVFGQIKYVKVNAWEEYFYQKLDEARNVELGFIKMKRYLFLLLIACFWLTPFLVIASTLAWYTLTGNELTNATAFLVVSVFSNLREPMMQIPTSLQSIFNCKLSIDRIQNFLNTQDLDTKFITHNLKPSAQENTAVKLQNGTFNWGGEQKQKDKKQQVEDIELGQMSKQILQDINIDVQKGKLVAFIGDIGAGKSSLLLSLLGEMKYNHSNSPKLMINGSLSLVNQKPWIISATVKANILFGLPFDQKKYQDCIKYSQLEHDLKILSNGENTMIGDKGVNLSGGQKTRIALARALYAESDILLLDDILSAVDIHVGTSIVKECLLQYKKFTTRLLVTHALYYMKYMDYIYLIHDGKIEEQGDFKTIRNQPRFKQVFDIFMQEQLKQLKENLQRRSSVASMGFSLPSTNEDIGDLSQLSEDKIEEIFNAQLIEIEKEKQDQEEKEKVKQQEILLKQQEEEKKREELKKAKKDQYDDFILEEDRQIGNISSETFNDLFQKFGSYTYIVVMCLLLTIASGLRAYSYIWLAEWTQSGTQETNEMYLKGYIYLSLSFVVFDMLNQYFNIQKTIAFSSKIHKEMMQSLLYAPLNQFFERIPLGRILTRLTSHITEVDMELNSNWAGFCSLLFQGFTNTGLLIYTTSVVMIFPVILFFYFCKLLQSYVQNTNREVKRLEQTTKNPIASSFAENLNGLDSIRAYRQDTRLFMQQCEQFDELKKNQISLTAMTQFLRQTLAIFSLIINIGALYIVFFTGSIRTELLGILLIYAFNLDGNIRFSLIFYSFFENKIVAYERCRSYQNIPCEPGYKKYMPQILEARQRGQLVDISPELQEWPQNGEIHFQNVEVKYRENLDTVLKGLEISIDAHEKIGVVGRTGAGKSTITLSLLRVLELFKGNIFIDEVDISEINLFDLRQRITIILQDPQLFQGTIKENIDPLGKHSDEEILEKLHLCNLEKFLNERKGLDTQIADSGSNLSIGEKQLICIARALLKKSKVVLIDEATANIDIQTEQIIQATLTKVFKECTVITIAHRINTIMNSDRILVMDKGIAAEIGTPQELMQNKNSIFYAIHEASKKEGGN